VAGFLIAQAIGTSTGALVFSWLVPLGGRTSERD
jgi:hypothetical protein